MKEKIKQGAIYCGIPFLFFCAVLAATILTAPTPPIIKEAQNDEVYVSPSPAPVSFILKFVNIEVCIQLDFDLNCTHIYSPEDPILTETENYITVSDDAFAKIIDRFGGADIALPFIAQGFDNLERHYTGRQLYTLFTNPNISENNKYKLRILTLFELFNNISKTGLKGTDFQYIINMCNSNISYVKYYSVRNGLQEVFAHCDYIG